MCVCAHTCVMKQIFDLYQPFWALSGFSPFLPSFIP